MPHGVGLSDWAQLSKNPPLFAEMQRGGGGFFSLALISNRSSTHCYNALFHLALRNFRFHKNVAMV